MTIVSTTHGEGNQELPALRHASRRAGDTSRIGASPPPGIRRSTPRTHKAQPGPTPPTTPDATASERQPRIPRIGSRRLRRQISVTTERDRAEDEVPNIPTASGRSPEICGLVIELGMSTGKIGNASHTITEKKPGASRLDHGENLAKRG